MAVIFMDRTPSGMVPAALICGLRSFNSSLSAVNNSEKIVKIQVELYGGLCFCSDTPRKINIILRKIQVKGVKFAKLTKNTPLTSK